MYPTPSDPASGVFVKDQVDTMRRLRPDWVIDVLNVNTRHAPLGSKLAYVIGALQVLARTTVLHYDLVHGHYVYAGLMARFQTKVPVIVTFHGSDVMDPKQRRVSKMLARVSSRIIVVNQRMAGLLGPGFADRTRVVPCGIDLTKFRPLSRAEARRRLGLDQDELYILFPSNPARAVKRYPLFRAALDCIDRPVRELVLHNIPHDHVVDYFAACDVMLLTSEWEGSPMVIKEALACNTPIVSVAVGDVVPLLTGVPNCRVVDPKPEALATAVCEIFDHPTLTGGREAVLPLGHDTIGEKVLNTYQEVLVGSTIRSV